MNHTTASYTTRQAADYLGTSVRTLQQLAYDRRIAFVKVGRLIRFRPTDLDAFLSANRVPTTAEIANL